jgi:endonuclease/exonuclease/phosphatase family metal-dependent hydrolase
VLAVTDGAPDRPRAPLAHTLPPELGTPTRVSLVAVVTVLAIELVRMSGPLLDHAFTVSVGVAAGAALGTYASAGLVAAMLLVLTARRTPGVPDGTTVLAGVVALGVVRLVLQALDGTARFAVGLGAVALGVAVLTLAVAFTAGRPGGGRQAGLGLVLGTGLSTGLQLALGTWDAVWRPGPTGWVVTVVPVLLSVVVARAARDDAPTGRPRRLWSLGPFLALVVMVLANPAFAASQAHVRLDVAGLVLVGATTVAAWVLLNPHLLVAPVRVGSAVVLPFAVLAAFTLVGPGALVAVAVLEVVAGVVVSSATSTSRAAPPGVPGTAFVTAGVGIGIIVPVLVHVVHYDAPLPVDNAVVPVAAALAVAVAGLRRRTPTGPGGGAAGVPERDEIPPFRTNAVRLLALPALVLAVVGWWPAAAAGPGAQRSRTDELVVLDWNLHYGVGLGPGVDLEQVARTIEAADPDVVTLQEVSRGWVLGGGVDTATWLSHRLGMQVEHAAAADEQFGNAILSRSALTDPVRTALPYGAGPQERSALTTTVTLTGGTQVTVTSVHLQHRETGAQTRIDQLTTLLDALGGGTPAVLAGDLNAEPGSRELDVLLDAGWVTAAPREDDGLTTFPADDPARRIDWVLVRGGEPVATEVLTGLRTSDHLPVLVRVVVAP